MSLGILERQVTAMRAAIGTLQAQVDAITETMQVMLQASTPVACTHEDAENVGTIGEPVWNCPTCGQHNVTLGE